MDIEFSYDDILDYFLQKGGKVIYTELVTHFKQALSNPETQANARVLFKNYVNQLANVINENGKKYLILRPKYKKSFDNSSITSGTSPTTTTPPLTPNMNKDFNAAFVNNKITKTTTPLTNGNINSNDFDNDKNINEQTMFINGLNFLSINNSHNNNNNNNGNNNYKCQMNQNYSPIYTNCSVTNSHGSSAQFANNNNNNFKSVNQHHSQQQHPPILPQRHQYHHQQHYYRLSSNTATLPTINEITNNNFNNVNGSTLNTNNIDLLNGVDNDKAVDIGDQTPPPRPPPRKKNSFRSTVKPNPVTLTSKSTPTSALIRNNNNNNHHHQNNNNGDIQPQQANDLVPVDESFNTVKKEIQELSLTPGRVKEHAQILNKLVLDTKLPMPTTTTNSISQVVNKLRNSHTTTTSHSDTDSGSVTLTDPLKKRWIIASSNCDFQEMLSLLKQDDELCRYCDSITGYNALHWAAKFNKPEIIKLIAGNFKVNPNIKSFSGSTPLHVAAEFKNKDIMKILIYHYKADKELRDNYGKKAQHYLEPKKSSTNNNRLKSIMENSPLNNNVPNESAAENLKNNLRNKISHQSMLVRNTLRNTKAFKRRKSMNEKSKEKNVTKS